MRINRSINKLRQDIKQSLQQLKLGALQQELEKQYDEPNFETLSFERRLSDALNNVCEKRSALNYEKLMDRAHISADVRAADFEDYWATTARQPYSSLIEQLKTCEWLIKERPANLIIAGASGSGKSWLASAFAREACRLNLRLHFVSNTKKFLDDLKELKLDGAVTRYLNKIIKTQLLILDDFLLDELNNQECHWLHQIIQERYQKRATVILSQRPLETWAKVLPLGANADAIMDRLLHYSHYIQLNEEKSLRTFIEN